MKKILALILLLVLVSSVVVSGQGITYDTGFQVQNLGTAQANITVTYYNQDGSVAASVADTIAAGGSKTYYPLTAVPDGFNGSVVITSDQPVAAIANELGNAGAYGASYAGFSAGATEVNLPLVMRNNGGFNTWFNVQNAGTADANVTVAYTPGAHGSPYTEMATIKPGAAHTFDQAGLTALGPRFVGSPKVKSALETIHNAKTNVSGIIFFIFALLQGLSLLKQETVNITKPRTARSICGSCLNCEKPPD